MRERPVFGHLAVDPKARGVGAGKALAEACIELARAKRHEQVIIHTTNAMKVAWGMYERLGFARAPDLDFFRRGWRSSDFGFSPFVASGEGTSPERAGGLHALPQGMIVPGANSAPRVAAVAWA